MQPLDKTLRNRLERTIKDARDIAEDAARAALEQLGVGEASPFAHLCEQERELRRKLRIHGRQLGDSRNGDKFQSVDRLIEEVAYEHWHRMLFARFLAENNLLMYPDPNDPVAVTLEECEDLAPDEGAANGWELAARFAARMLPQIFRLDSPVFELTMPPEHQQKMERLVADLPQEVFTASDSLGWVYQFWQAKKKDEVNASEVKIGARELPAVTQLFTEPYMVSFLLDNSLGAWWATKRLSEADFKNANSEEELRQKAAILGVPLDYLRFVQQEDGTWTPAAGTFDSWPEQLAELKTLDPCCGSGHFLVAAFLMLVPMRMELEGLSAREAVDAVLRENIHGLELDQRCVALAAFALALTAWKYPDAGGYRMLPELHVACSGLSVSVAKEEWKLLGSREHNLGIALGWMHDTFKDAPSLGSLINPAKTGAEKVVEWESISQALNEALGREQGDEQREVAVVAQGLAKAAILLAGKYQWVVTNVPYKKAAELSDIIRTFLSNSYPAGKTALETAFMERCMELLAPRGVASIVAPQNPLFLTSYRHWRKKMLTSARWRMVAWLGEGGFNSSAAAGAFTALFTLSNEQLGDRLFGGLIENKADGSSPIIRGMDASQPRTAAEKAEVLKRVEIRSVEQARQLENPDAVFSFQPVNNCSLLSERATINYGSKPGQTDRVVKNHWEFFGIPSEWQLLESTPAKKRHYSGKESVCLVLDEIARQNIKEFGIRSQDVWGKPGIIQSQMREMPFSIYCSNIFDNNTSVLTQNEAGCLAAIYSFIESGEYLSQIRTLNQKLDVAAHTMVKVPFDPAHWTRVAEEKYPNGLPKPYTDDPTQWIFHGHPCGSVIWNEEKKWTAHGPLRTDHSVLHVAVARLLGYRWPAELDPNMELADEQREWVKRCEALASYADEDGIVCIPPVRGEAAASDRLLNLLAAAYGDAWSNDTLASLLTSADHAGKTLETWLREKFFTQHCKLFQHRPFIWHIWDGLRDGFASLVNYHKLDSKLLETLIYTYLGDWISRQKQDIATNVDGAAERLDAAEVLKKRLELILEGEAPYDIFVRWKPLEKQPIGWDPDLNDGVRLNIRPFMTVPDVGRKGAGCLRDKPNIDWRIDRGKDVESAPLHNLFKGVRVNDHHLKLSEKRMAREKEFQL